MQHLTYLLIFLRPGGSTTETIQKHEEEIDLVSVRQNAHDTVVMQKKEQGYWLHEERIALLTTDR